MEQHPSTTSRLRVLFLCVVVFSFLFIVPAAFLSGGNNPNAAEQKGGTFGATLYSPAGSAPLAGAVQEKEPSGIMTGPSYKNDVSPALRDMKQLPIVPKAKHEAAENPKLPHDHVDMPDPVVQNLLAPDVMPTTILNFDGIPFPGVACNCAPPDTDGEVGLSQYVQIVNEGYQVFNKSTGVSVLGPSGITTIWQGFGGACENGGDGDPIVLYDQIANRWLISQFAEVVGTGVPTDECIAVSTSSDATGTYNRYGFHLGSNFFDYPKIGVWPDGYYMSDNVFNAAGTAFLGVQPFVFDRSRMLAGLSATFITPGLVGTVPANEESFLPADLDGSTLPAAGTPCPFVEFPGSGAGGTYRTWLFHADFVTPANSTFIQRTSPSAAGFTLLCPTTRACVPQPAGTNLDGIGDRLMHRLPYRIIGGVERVVGNFTVSSGGVAGIRWFELRNVTSGSESVFQESTYQPDTTWRWMGSAAQDKEGDMALGFSASSTTVFPSIRYAGRLLGDATGILGQGEATMFAGLGSQLATNSRWGDYSAMSIDPVDDCTFWYTQEYYPAGTTNYNWRTRIGSFRFASCFGAAQPVISSAGATLASESCAPANGVLDPNETVTVSFCVQNGGSASTTSLVGTLQNTGGVAGASGPEDYGIVVIGGAPVCRNFTFNANGTCGGTVTATIHFQDGATDLGNVTYNFTLGVSSTPLTENFDGVTVPALPAGWTTAATGAESAWVTSATTPNSAPNDAFAPNPSAVGNTELVTPAIAIPASGASQLSFKNNYSTEATYDGMVLEISINGGAFSDILTAGGTFVTGGYNAMISTCCSNPIAGRQAWSGNSGGYITSTINLPAGANGQNIQLKWRVASDSSVSATGVRIDNITIGASAFTCCQPAGVPSFAIDDVTHNEGNAGTTSYTFTVTKTGSTALNATVNFQTQDQSATLADNDYQANSGTLTFLPADTTATITVLVNGDATFEPNETFYVNLSSPTNAILADSQGIGTITNDDVVPLSSPWPMQGHDAQRTGRGSASGPVTATVKWTYQFNSGPFFHTLQDQASPVVGPDGTIYQPTSDAFYAINPDGTLKWSRVLSGIGMRNAPALSPDGNTVYIILNYAITALDTQNGNVRWQYALGAGEDVSYSSMAVDGNGAIYIGTRLPAALYAVNPNGTLKWRYAVPGGTNLGIEAAPAIDVNGNVYVEINATGLVALDANGNYRWTAPYGGDYGWFTPTVGPDGTVYIAGDHDGQNSNQSATALNFDGSLKWQRSASEIGAAGFFAGMAISADGSTVYTGRGNGKVAALNAVTGAIQWVSQITTTDSFSGSPVLSNNGILYLAGWNGYIYAVWAGDGSLLWRYELETISMYWGAQSPALGPDGTLYAVSSGLPPAYGGIKGRLYAFKDSGCWFMLNSMSQSFAAAGGTGSVNVTAGAAGCNWTAVSNDAFITITSGSSGSGNGTVDYSVDANTSDSPRSGTMTIAGRTFRVNQAGSLPSLGNYPNTSVQLGANTTVTPDAAPTHTTSINVSATSDFRGTLAGSPATGIIQVTNAQPAGTYFVTVTAFNSLGVTTAKTFTLTVNHPMPCDTPGFSAAVGSPFAAGSGPASVAVGDFNGDGKQDLAIANYSSNSVTVLLGNDSGGFISASGSPFAVGTSPHSVAAGDFNGDGKQDLAIANSSSNNVTVLLGNGSGGFTPASGSPFATDRFGSGFGPWSVAVGDFNSDGKQDLATANLNSDNVTVLLGNGSGGFTMASGSPFAVGTWPQSVAVDDFNGDGKLDLATANSTSNNVTVLLGNGSGGFSAASGSPFAAGTWPLFVAVGDFNSDGKQDLATANATSNRVTVLLGNGSGGFGPGSSFVVGSRPLSVAVGDFNGDGNQDLTTTNADSNNVTVLLGNGGGGFTPASGSPFTVGTDPRSVVVGDFNRDGKLDLTNANQGSNNVTVLLNTCTSNTTPTISAVGVTRQQGSPSANAIIANVNDLEDLETALTVTVNGAASATVNGVTVSAITVNAAGVVTANVVASCTATTATFTLRVTDTGGLFNEATLTVMVNSNTAPTLTYSSPQAVVFGGSLNVSPTTTVDNGTVTYSVQAGHGLTPPPSVDASGVVSITNAQPAGAHTITIRATDNCGAFTDAAFTLNVGELPTFTIDDVTHNEGNGGTTSFVFTVTRNGSTPLTLSVDFTTVDGTATTANNDYQANSGTLNFLPTDTTKTIIVLVNGDTTFESDEAFTVHLSGATFGGLHPPSPGGTGTIINDDACSFTLSSNAENFSAAGGMNSVNVITATGCAWVAVSNDAFIMVTSGSPGSGNGTVNYSVVANTGPARTGTMTIAGITFTVTQDSGCTLTLDRDHESFAGNGGNGSVNITASNAACAWTANTTSIFVTITSGGSGTGNGAVQYTVAANAGSTIRSDTITIAGHSFTVYQGINFLDVPSDNPFYDDIGKLAARGVTVGCGSGNYCPNNPVTRDQMAAFILRAKGEFDPPAPPSQRFNDVPSTNVFYNFIDRLAELQITLGCTPDHLMYCPSDPVRREQMAAFILRGLGEFDPPTPGSQRFDDVPSTNLFYSFIDRLAALQITLGCTPDHLMYCPSDSVTRAQMAAFLVRAFNL